MKTSYCYGDLFKSVRQQVCAFRYYLEFHGHTDNFKKMTEEDYLDDAYRFLNTWAGQSTFQLKRCNKFLKFCAKKEKYKIGDYIDMLLDA